MSDRPEGLRPFRRETTRGKPLYTAGPLAPWHAVVVVTPLELERQVDFEVSVTWTGPPAYGFPPARDPVQASDVVMCGGDPELARAVAIAAEDDLRRLEVPDLRGHLARFRQLRASG